VQGTSAKQQLMSRNDDGLTDGHLFRRRAQVFCARSRQLKFLLILAVTAFVLLVIWFFVFNLVLGGPK
jgi:hypothetical protein